MLYSNNSTISSCTRRVSHICIALYGSLKSWALVIESTWKLRIRFSAEQPSNSQRVFLVRKNRIFSHTDARSKSTKLRGGGVEVSLLLLMWKSKSRGTRRRKTRSFSERRRSDPLQLSLSQLTVPSFYSRRYLFECYVSCSCKS